MRRIRLFVELARFTSGRSKELLYSPCSNEISEEARAFFSGDHDSKFFDKGFVKLVCALHDDFLRAFGHDFPKFKIPQRENPVLQDEGGHQIVHE